MRAEELFSHVIECIDSLNMVNLVWKADPRGLTEFPIPEYPSSQQELKLKMPKPPGSAGTELQLPTSCCRPGIFG